MSIKEPKTSRNRRACGYCPSPLLFFLMLTAAVTPAHANMIISPTFLSSCPADLASMNCSSGITGDPKKAAIEGAITSAISFYEATFTNSMNVNIEFGEMSSGLGESVWTASNYTYGSFRAALAAEAGNSTNVATAVANLPCTGNQLTCPNPVTGGVTMYLKPANAKALGLPTGQLVDGVFDGAVLINTSITDVNGGSYSLFAAVEHEIDEVLGLGSDLGTGLASQPFPEDLYRYDGNGNRTFTTSSSTQAFFSLDGTTHLAQFDNQNDGGDFGDWQSNPLPNGVSAKVQDAFAYSGTSPSLSSSSPELVALNSIGYSEVPEPSPGVLMLIGLAAMAVSAVSRSAARRRRATRRN